ncbi:MAG: DeoR/GlpR transcriptional regulator [Chthonomonadales bacterium]|nr:DeoR/GlpR transcriptional regulator [Chthonomonadales bacterium]
MSPVDGTEPGAMFAEERQRAVVERLRSAGKVTVEELAAAFHVSAPTVRADLARLEDRGLLRRTHGGAIRADGTLFEPPYDQRQVMRHVEKRAIARAAAARVKDGETVLLDAGTSSFEIALLLKERAGLTIVTNSIANAVTLMENPALEVVLVGGSVQPRRRATLGPLAVGFLDRLCVDRAFLAFNGVHPEAGFTVVDFDAAEVKRRMMERATETIAVADSDKIGRVAFAWAAPLSAARLLITDSGIAEDDRARLTEKGLAVEIARV